MNRKKILIPIIILTIFIIILIIVLKPSTRYNKISINENKWNSIISSRTENTNLVLKDIEFNDYNLIIDEKNSTLYYSIISDSKTKYNPDVSFNASDNSAKLAILSDEITDTKVQNNYEFKIMIYNESVYHIYNLICTNLPILNISYNTNVKSKQKGIQAEIYLFDNMTRIPNRVTISRAKLKLTENNYIFSLNMTTPGKNIRENKRSIFNMDPHSEYILNSTSNDNKGQKGELFINNEYVGVYSLNNYKEYKEWP